MLLRPCWCSAAVEPLRRLGCLMGSSLLGRRLSPVPVTVQSSLPLASSCPRRRGALDQGCAAGVGEWAFYTSWPRWVLGLSGECTCIYCFNLSPSWLYYPCSEPNFPFKRSFLSKRRLRPSCQLLLRVELNASSPVAATERCVSWDL